MRGQRHHPCLSLRTALQPALVGEPARTGPFRNYDTGELDYSDVEAEIGKANAAAQAEAQTETQAVIAVHCSTWPRSRIRAR
jgi:hypothetical protein